MTKSIECMNQLRLFEKPRYEFSDLGDIKISHKRNFRIEMPYLLEHLSQYNNYLKDNQRRYLKNDNVLLRIMYRGIQNSIGMAPEIFDGLNALEICLIEAGIDKRKSFYVGEMVIQPKWSIHQEPIIVRRKAPSSCSVSRLKEEGRLDGKHLYEIVTDLLTATGVRQIYGKYKRDWQTIFQLEEKKLEKKQERFKRLNPYNPLTLKQRMDHIEREYLDILWKIKKVLEEPFIPERIVRMERYETPTISEPETFVKVVHNGFITPRSINRCAEEVYNYFQMK